MEDLGNRLTTYLNNIKNIVEQNEDNYINKKIILKLQMFYEPCVIDKSRFINHYIYNKYIYYKKESFKKETPPDIIFRKEDEDIKEIVSFISELNALNNEGKIINVILIKEDKKKLIIYTGVKDELKKFKFIIKDSEFFGSIDIIISRCSEQKINFINYKNKPESNNTRDLFRDAFINMTEHHDEKAHYDINLGKIIESKNLSESEELFGKNNNHNIEDSEGFEGFQLDTENNLIELQIFVINLKYFYENFFNSVNYAVTTDKEKNLPVIYLLTNDKGFEITFIIQDNSFDEFKEFCKKVNIIIY